MLKVQERFFSAMFRVRPDISPDTSLATTRKPAVEKYLTTPKIARSRRFRANSIMMGAVDPSLSVPRKVMSEVIADSQVSISRATGIAVLSVVVESGEVV